MSALASVVWMLIAVLVAFIGLLCFSPFVVWRSFNVVTRSVIFTRSIPSGAKLRLLGHLGKELVYTAVLTVLWSIDEILFPRYHRTRLAGPVFIMSQPRSGTTLLHRTLALDTQSFFSLSHIEWRLPSLTLWKVLDALRLRDRVARINYWSNTELGQLASRLHAHVLGNTEEHGIFLEERMYHHYFTFRRFPLLEVLRRVGDIDCLTVRETQKILRTFSSVVAKVAYYRGAGRIWLTKENESVDFYRLLYKAFPGARFLVITRPPNAFIPSYLKLSQVCTSAKHGIVPTGIPGWHEANMDFRRVQASKQVTFCHELERDDAVMYLSFDAFTKDIAGTVKAIYDWLGIPMSADYLECLIKEQGRQDVRSPGYTNDACDVTGFDEYSAFLKRRCLDSLKAI